MRSDTACRRCDIRHITYVHSGLCSVCTFAPKPKENDVAETPYKPCPHCMVSERMLSGGVCDNCRAVINAAGGHWPATSCPNAEPRPPAKPTAFLPGTHEKLMVLRRRVEMGCGLWHPDDARDRDLDPGISALDGIWFAPH